MTLEKRLWLFSYLSITPGIRVLVGCRVRVSVRDRVRGEIGARAVVTAKVGVAWVKVKVKVATEVRVSIT